MKEEKLIEFACYRFKKVVKTKFEKFKTLPDWLNKESGIFYEETNQKEKNYGKYKRGQIIKVDFGINIGAELCFTHFAIVLNNEDNIYNENLLVLPITSKDTGKKRISLGKILLLAYPNSTKYNLECYANISQITTISKTRIYGDSKKFICDNKILDIIDKAIVNNFTKIKLQFSQRKYKITY